MGSSVLFLMGLAVVLALSGGVALADIRQGTDAAETLVGTNAADRITGGGGNDALKGKAANDTYHFANRFGEDTLTETTTVGKKRLPGDSLLRQGGQRGHGGPSLTRSLNPEPETEGAKTKEHEKRAGDMPPALRNQPAG